MSGMFDPDHPSAAFALPGHVALVTGGAGGIGRAVSRALLASGARVAAADLDGDAAGRFAGELMEGKEGAQALGCEIDVAEEASVEAALDRIDGELGPVTLLVNNAGIAIREPSVALGLAAWQKVVDVNMTGVFLCARAVVRRFESAPPGASPPSIVNMASIMGLSGGGLYPNPSYQATKGAVVNMTRAMAIEWAPLGIRVNALAPTWVRTGFIDQLVAEPGVLERIQAVTPLGRLAEPEEVAAAALFLLSPAASMITGHTLPVDGGYLAQ